MNMKTLLVAAGLAVAVTGGAIAQHSEGHWGHGGGDAEFLHGLNLTDAQKSAAREIGKANWEQMKAVGAQMHALHEQIVTGLLSGQSKDQLAALVTQEETLRTQMDTARLETAVKLRDLLTPAQLSEASDKHAKLAALHAQERDVMHEGAPE